MRIKISEIFITLILLSSLLYPKNVLIIGDSMAEAIKNPISLILANNGIATTTHFKRGTRVDFWLKNYEIFANDLKNADFIIVTLGTNDLFSNKKTSRIVDELEQLEKILTQNNLSKESIFYISTPLKSDMMIFEALKNRFGERVFDSKSLNLTMSKDNVHPMIASDILWSALIVEKLSNYNNFLKAVK